MLFWTKLNKDGMSSIFRKLNLKSQTEILVVNAPATFEKELAELEGVAVSRDPKKMKTVAFALLFATKQSEVDGLSRAVAGKAGGDVVLWVAYPKQTSKRYKCEFNRDSGWKVIRGLGFDSVRMVAIDDDWSALRFRRVEFIKAPK
jgi:hypothetical protein